jgi:hypothetical protein
MVYVVDVGYAERTIESARTFEDIDKHHVLGAIRRMEANYMRREWPEDGAQGQTA